MAVETAVSYKIEERASECLDDLRTAVLKLDHVEDDRAREEILNKLESLRLLLSQGNLQNSERYEDGTETALQFRSPARLSRDHETFLQPRRYPKDLMLGPTSDRYGILGDDIDAEDTLESDDSFLRLSTMLERSISQGQEALSSPRSTSPRVDARRQASDSLNVLSSTRLPCRAPAMGDALEDERFPQARSTDRPRSPLSVFDDSEDEDEADEDLCSRPPEYMAIDSTLPKTQPANSVIDEGLTALNSLIDQLTNSTTQRSEGGLTSSKALFLCSLLVLLVSFLVSNQSGELGVNCHCICPTMTTT